MLSSNYEMSVDYRRLTWVRHEVPLPQLPWGIATQEKRCTADCEKSKKMTTPFYAGWNWRNIHSHNQWPKLIRSETSSLPTTRNCLAMEALKLQKKFPDVSRDEMFELMNRFKCVPFIPTIFTKDLLNSHWFLAVLCERRHLEELTSLPFCKIFSHMVNLMMWLERHWSMSVLTPVARWNWKIGLR